jgi:hypothetical protein
MHRYIAVFIIMLLVSFSGCNFFRAPGKDRCEKLISKEKMTALLGDVYLLEAYLQSEKSGSPNYEDTVMYFYGGLLTKHGVTRLEFKQALSCYLLYEEDIQQIHEDILQRFSILESELGVLDYASDPDSLLMQTAAAASIPDTLKILPDTLLKEITNRKLYQWWPAIANFSIPFIYGDMPVVPDSITSRVALPVDSLPDGLIQNPEKIIR